MSSTERKGPEPWPEPPKEPRLRSTAASPNLSPTGGAPLQPLPPRSPPGSTAAAAAAKLADAAPSSTTTPETSLQQQEDLLSGSSGISVPISLAAGNGRTTASAGVAAAAAAASLSPASNNSSNGKRYLGGIVGLAPARAHHLRVRKLVPLSQNLTAELGVGKELLSGEVTRHAALTYDLNVSGKHLVSLRASPGLLQAARTFTVSLPKSCASAAVRLVAGVTREGKPVFGFDIDDVRPPKIVAAAAAAALASGKPVAGAKSVPVFTTRLPGVYDTWCGRVEVRAVAQKKEAALGGAGAGGGGRGGGTAGGGRKGDDIFGPLTLDVRELNFVLDV